MNISTVGIIVLCTALPAFFIARRSRVLPIIILGLVASILGGAGFWMVENGPQSAFSHLPVSATVFALCSAFLLVGGAGAFSGGVLASGLRLVKKRQD
jgi:hypothetical protein